MNRFELLRIFYEIDFVVNISWGENRRSLEFVYSKNGKLSLLRFCFKNTVNYLDLNSPAIRHKIKKTGEVEVEDDLLDDQNYCWSEKNFLTDLNFNAEPIGKDKTYSSINFNFIDLKNNLVFYRFEFELLEKYENLNSALKHFYIEIE